jgi:hypothetical protein
VSDKPFARVIGLASITRTYVKSRGIDATVLDGGSRMVFTTTLLVGEERDCQLVVYEDSRVIRFFVGLPQHIPHNRREWVKGLVAVANEELSIFGFFVLSEVLGLHYHVAARIADEDSLPLDVLEALIDRVRFPVKTFELALKRLNRINVSPAAAMQAALIEGEAKDAATATTSVRNALLTLLK